MTRLGRAEAENLAVNTLDQEEITVVATDSGLGGLAISSEIAERLRSNGSFRKAHIIFFNCLPSETVGFDAMTSNERRYLVLSNALDAIAERFSPDAILLACNTISVLYGKTTFSTKTHVPVLSIVKMGADMISEYLEQEPQAQVVLFATRTTVQSGVHKGILVERGHSPEKLVYQECTGLVSAIERGPQSGETYSLVRKYVSEAVAKLPYSSLPAAAALLCTHFGFAEKLFRKAFIENAPRAGPLLDPSLTMVETFLAAAKAGRFADPQVSVEVISQAPIPTDRREAIAGTIRGRSDHFADALLNYKLTPGLFNIE